MVRVGTRRGRGIESREMLINNISGNRESMLEGASRGKGSIKRKRAGLKNRMKIGI